MKSPVVLKIGVIFALCLVLLIPLSMVQSLIHERSGFKEVARFDVAQSWTSDQTIVAPVLVVPYSYKEMTGFQYQEVDTQKLAEKTQKGQLLFMADELNITARPEIEKRYRGIHAIPVYTSTVSLSGSFDLGEVRRRLSEINNVVKIDDAYVSVSVSDIRGIVNRPMLSWSETKTIFDSKSRLGKMPGLHAVIGDVEGFKFANMSFSADFELRGMEKLQFAPLGKVTSTKIESTWPHPSFIGRYLPVAKEISSEGFTASWTQSELATGMMQNLRECEVRDCSGLSANVFGVSLIEPVDVYRQTTRSAKHGILFVVLLFASFFLFEIFTRRKIHLIQYGLIGLALCLFYLVLLSAAEFIDFPLAYTLAAAACVGLIGYYVRYVLGSTGYALSYTAGLSVLFGVLYIIVRAEEYALLMGSVLLFVTLGSLMFITRKTDWYTLEQAFSPDLRIDSKTETPANL